MSSSSPRGVARFRRARASSTLALDRAARRARGCDEESRLKKQSLALTLFRHQREAGAHRVRAAPKLTAAPSIWMRAGVWAVQAEDRFEQLRAARADETKEADDLAARDMQRDVAKVRRAREVVNRQARVVGLRTRRVRFLRASCYGGSSGEVPSNHRPDDVGWRRRRAVVRCRPTSPSRRHRDAIAQPEHFRQAMRHIDDRRAAALQLAQHVEQMIRFRVGERGGRLVEHEDLAIERQRARHLQQLAMCGRQRTPRGCPDRCASDSRSSSAAVRARIAASSSRAVAADLSAREDVGRRR